MSSFSDKVEEIKAKIDSRSKENKSLAYSTLLLLQEQSSDDPSSLQTLADSSPDLVSSITVDISVDDEEIAAQALKCLGFMIYHPSLVSTIPVSHATIILKALAKVIMTTKMKFVCNLGVWCISMQQFDASFMSAHFHLVLPGVLHALDNPMGSLSITFEAMQAIMKLAAQLRDKVGEFSHLWAPPVYRRLLSFDKRERDISERCLLKIRSAICPPSAALSKALAEDLKAKLLVGMRDHLNQGMKVQTMQAWGWFILLLGINVMKKRHLVNDMLKIPEQMFSDYNPQVQIASLVAWESLVDALISPILSSCESNEATRTYCCQHDQTLGGNASHIQGSSKGIELIMMPLIGIISSKCDATVHSACLNTWCYLLHKLGVSVNHPTMIELVLHPIFETVFRIGPDSKAIWVWNLCLDILEDFILAKCRNLDYESGGQATHNLPVKAFVGHSEPSKSSWMQNSIKWLPWDVNRLDFFIKMINSIINHASIATTTPDKRTSVCDAALRLFRSLLRGVQMELKSSSLNYDGLMSCLNLILKFIKKTCEDFNPKVRGYNELRHASLQFLEAATEELAPSILGSPLYKVALDIRYVESLQHITDIDEKFLGFNIIAYMDMVSPLIYLIVLYVCMVIQSTSLTCSKGLILQRSQKFFKFIVLSDGHLESLCITVGLLYKHVEYRYLESWIAMAKGLKDSIDGVKDASLLKLESNNIGYLAICHLLSYPFVICSHFHQRLTHERISVSLEEFQVSADIELNFELVIEVWKSLYDALYALRFKCSSTNGFHEDVCSMLNGLIDENSGCNTELNQRPKSLDLHLLSLYGNAVTCIMEQILILAASLDRNKDKEGDESKLFSGINNSLEFAARFLKLSWTMIESDPTTTKNLLLTSRVFSVFARVASCLHVNQTILSFIKMVTCPLLLWLSHGEAHDESITDEIQQLWVEILNCLRRSQPPIIFNSCFLEFQAPLLEKTLNHPKPAIKELTINFWNSTYGEQIKLNYPESLLDLLDKLSRTERIKLHKRNLPFLVKCHSATEVNAQRCRVTTTRNSSSKRIELMKDMMNQFEQKDERCSISKRKRLELTEHQKEVRRAQQGRQMDCSGHGPGIRTYTSVDFSRSNEDSQESQEIQDPESILDMLRRGAAE